MPIRTALTLTLAAAFIGGCAPKRGTASRRRSWRRRPTAGLGLPAGACSRSAAPAATARPPPAAPRAPTCWNACRRSGRAASSAACYRYDWGIPASQASSEKARRASAGRGDPQRRQGAIQMPAWQGEPRVQAHIADLYAWLSARPRARRAQAGRRCSRSRCSRTRSRAAGLQPSAPAPIDRWTTAPGSASCPPPPAARRPSPAPTRTRWPSSSKPARRAASLRPPTSSISPAPSCGAQPAGVGRAAAQTARPQAARAAGGLPGRRRRRHAGLAGGGAGRTRRVRRLPAPPLRPQASTLLREVTHLHLHGGAAVCAQAARPRASTTRWRRWRVPAR